MWPGYAGTTMNLQIVLNIKKKIPTKIKPPKKILAKFPTRNEKFQTQKNPLMIPVT